jgi:hypothetical protein
MADKENKVLKSILHDLREEDIWPGNASPETPLRLPPFQKQETRHDATPPTRPG